MKLTKHAHACVVVEDRGVRILIDPGTFTPNARDLLAQADAVLITHDHFDHFDLDAVRDALQTRPQLTVFGPSAVIQALTASGIEGARLHRVADGEQLTVAGIDVTVVGGPHALIHDGISVPDNAGYLIAGTVYHPGDAYAVPATQVDTVLVPSSGPWTKVGDAIDFVRAIAPRQTVPIHEAMLSEIGIGSFARFLGPDGLTGVELVPLAPGASIEI
ncbi:MBL fold metallo-hydrolase [Microbacterium protaetiae]|uniref:MBL fold metallo-hydrolase n=1 Tax=Microbacterium protaetiae TaxID=2509458 RepID=A0A4P6EEE3_9MICO|nr:MBL fold metallo-hydrolase [Microbacterium protaetiae]QAY59733.1 MBL fold metallo-hydrolase [Microbacterium protaetiae]